MLVLCTPLQVKCYQEMFLEQQIIKLEGLLKDHVTLKTGVMLLNIQLCHHRNQMSRDVRRCI